MNWRISSKILGGALLVAGTCIGAGMLGLPVSTAASGFYPTLGLFVVCWALMTLTAFLMLEVSLWFPGHTNLISMAQATLGKKGELVAWLSYVLFLYALMAAYTAGGGGIAASLLGRFQVPEGVSLVAYVTVFAGLVYCGARWVDLANRFIMFGLFVAYLGLTIWVSPHINTSLLAHGAPEYLGFTLPLVVTSFGFHLLIPSLKSYLEGDVNHLRLSIFLGSVIPLIVYALWEWIILGALPLTGETGLLNMLKHGNPAVELSSGLTAMVNSHWVALLAKGFSFCAILSSFIGVALGLFDFFADGLGVRRNMRGKCWLAFLTFIPPALFAWQYPTGFLYALNYAGVFAAVLLVIYPALMVLSGRYHLKISQGYQVAGGKCVPILALCFGLIVILTLVLTKLKWLPMP